MSSARRFSTIHDLASLRLHADGTRVPPDPLSNPSGSQISHPRQARRAIQDTRGNWIARDAGAVAGGAMKRRRGVGAGTESDEDGQGQASKKRKTSKGKRAARRVAFDNDLEFLGTPSKASESSGYHAIPSSVSPTLSLLPLHPDFCTHVRIC